ncbi:MAG: response regulator [Candidatus Promineifilaceae bacterium]|jgi:CheY-like chemotaxis protein
MRSQPLILIVDDEPFNIDYLEQELEDLGYDTASAMNGVEALEQVATCEPDMILLDVMMPVMDGFEVLKRLKDENEWRDIPVVIISAMSDINSIARGIEAGAEDYLPKPFDPTLLEARLHAGLEKKRLRDQEIEYLHQVDHLTLAAQAIEDNAFSPQSLDPVVAREDALGNLGRVFLRMAEEVHAREQRLQRQIELLKQDMAERREAAAETAVIYLPIDRRQALAAGRDLSAQAHGAALFADVSGFTPLTEALVQELGNQRGVEELVRQLNRVFSALVAEVHAFHGSVTSFGGDAITVWFDEDTGEQHAPPAGLRALACALALQEAIRPFTELATSSGQTISIGIKVTVAAGDVHRFLSGDPEQQVIEVLAGRVLDRIAMGDQLAERGEVLVGLELANALGDQLRRGEERPFADQAAETDGRDYHYVVVKALLVPVSQTPWPEMPGSILRPEQVRAWLPERVFEQVSAGQSDFLSQLRPATALFLHFGGIDYDGDEKAGEYLDRLTRRVQKTIREQDGQLLDLIIGDKGSYFYGVFGAPVALENDVLSAVTAALALVDYLNDLAFISDVRIGLTRGLMRAGAYGSSRRRTYSALSEATNNAARLMMAAAEGDILVDESIFERASQEFHFEKLAPIQVKGREVPLQVYRPLGPRSQAAWLRELDQLPPLQQMLLKTASILRWDFNWDLLAALCMDETARSHGPDLLQNLTEKGVLLEENGRYHFADTHLREAAYKTMLFAQRRRLHRAAAEWIENAYANDLGPHYQDLAFHWQGAEDIPKTIRYLELAAVHAREEGDLEGALEYFNKTLELQKTGE